VVIAVVAASHSPETCLSSEQRGLLEAARAQVDKEELAALLTAMVDIPSPTGAEGRLAEFLADYMKSQGLDARMQSITHCQANALGTVPGTGSGPDLLLYGHTDTHLSGDPFADAPSSSKVPPTISLPKAKRNGDRIDGLGACNPKGYSACMVAAASAVKKAGVPLSGDLLVGLAAAGMPTNSPDRAQGWRMGQGTGCLFMLRHGVRPDYALIGKPGFAVAWEEVGVCYFRVRVEGAFGYAGTRHLLEYDNPIVGAAEVVRGLEAWCESYPATERSGLVAPQASIGSLQAGWPYKPTFIPAWADLYLDVRVSPRTDPRQIKRDLRRALDEIEAGTAALRTHLEMLLAIPGSETEPGNWIIGSATRAHEAITGRAHEPIIGTSGATDAAFLRMWGIPTARLGMPRERFAEGTTFAQEMDSVDLDEMLTFVDCVLHVAIDTCTRSRGAV
jgi:acetylornithine deacetylase/succinyl-diaminopimelate desuccinylase-like protein